MFSDSIYRIVYCSVYMRECRVTLMGGGIYHRAKKFVLIYSYITINRDKMLLFEKYRQVTT
jgi:hypothetical protein